MVVLPKGRSALNFCTARRSTPFCLLLLLLPATVSAKQFYPITVTFGDSNPLCARRPEHRTIIVDDSSVSFQNPFEPCIGQLAPDGTFAIACPGPSAGVTYRLSGKLTGPTITGSIVATNKKRRAAADVQCNATFTGMRRGLAAKPAAH